jgi:hypothetical protein
MTKLFSIARIKAYLKKEEGRKKKDIANVIIL